MRQKGQTMIEVECFHCEKKFSKTLSRYNTTMKGKGYHYCGNECKNKSVATVREQWSHTEESVLDLIDKSPGFGPNKDCWKWTGIENPTNGYGYIHWKARSKDQKGSPVRAHRLIYEILVGPIPKGLVIMHSCDTRLCVNPDHLSPGAYWENDADRVAKDRQAKGEKISKLGLTDERVKQVKIDLFINNMRMPEVSKKYNIPYGSIQAIKMGITWKHIILDSE